MDEADSLHCASVGKPVAAPGLPARRLPVGHLSDASGNSRRGKAVRRQSAGRAPAERLRLLCALDDACQAPSGACAKEIAAQREEAGAGRGLSSVVRDFWQAQCDAYNQLLQDAAACRGQEAILAGIGVRMMRAGLHLMRWMAFDGEVPGDAQWRVLSSAYFIADTNAAATLGVPVRADRDVKTSVERGYLALSALDLLGPKQFGLADIELAIRLTLQSRARLDSPVVRRIRRAGGATPAGRRRPDRVAGLRRHRGQPDGRHGRRRGVLEAE